MYDLSNIFISNGKFSYQWVLDTLKSKDANFKKFLQLDDKCNQKEKKIVNVYSFDLSDGKGCFSEVFKIIFTAEDESTFSTILKVPGSLHLEDAINKSMCVDDNGKKFKTCDDMYNSIVRMHNRECDFYNKVKFTDCPLPKVFEAIYWIPNKKIHGCILMQDMGDKGKMQDVSESLTLGQINNVIKIVAKLHSFSIKNMERIKHYNMEFPLIGDDLNIITKRHIEILTKKYGSMLENLFNQFLPFVTNEKFFKYVNMISHIDYKLPLLLSHGDIWTNNIYFKTDEDGYITNDVEALFDWQFLHLGNPTLDIARFLMISVNGDIRNKYHDTIFDYYYNVLKKELGDIPIPFSLENFKECYKFSQLFQTYQLILMISIFTNYTSDKSDKNIKSRRYKEDILIMRLKHALEDGINIIKNDLKDFKYNF
ncbi:Protein kinase-like domain and Uncharacterised oxidoreductase Dhs-27 family and CHK kinase-like domain-containing protein [Strongyloides ratti]|uniref:Protein kinase-like domain and Uncharacterized oxidoreductase Dhs-27 family and CHK kinase-like domain-containing protein n=1 Tax=Strongyloides ratti TaxID=34506 RepID=A0A090KTL2_STRRB|nr:Protein kinase-like domain and Uncharacterised oxidoreductase Dhs-27 family and CHK kinase-like domain-containing protein [Strongyloides ratti]CEF60855.1 Protein kinase-like domain and Uncharacterised oxidoreductase Dhs-27 family and CHK kinase-like domain-containing protein [Strongyloides ratti]